MSDRPPANHLSLEAFQDVVDRFGENSAHWPEAQRRAAATLLETSPAARAILAEAAQIRSLMKRPSVQAPGRLLQAIDGALDATAQPDMQRVRALT